MTFVPRNMASGCGCDTQKGLISIDDALACIACFLDPLTETERLPLAQAKGRVLAAPICAQADMPRFDHAAMDGYALCAGDLVGEGPWVLPIAGRIAAGECAAQHLAHGTACRIFTGAPTPVGADCVVMQEHVDVTGYAVTLKARPKPADHIRFQGEEQKSGDIILKAGTMLTPRGIAACAAAGHGDVIVKRKLRVTVIATGSEVKAPGTPGLDAGQIWDVNSPMLQALTDRPDIELHALETVSDDLGHIQTALQAASSCSDLVLTTGGVSVGEEDYLHTAVRAIGGVLRFAGVAIKPGKPVTLGQIGKAAWLGLPGNPGSAFVTWTIFGSAVLRQLTGAKPAHPLRRHVILGQDITRKPGRCEVRGVCLAGMDGAGRDVVTCPGGVNSGQMTGLAHADGLAFFPADADHLPAGAMVEYLPLSIV